jgi:predicted dehydrogenase
VRLGVIGAGNYVSSMLLPHLTRRDDVALVEVVTNTALSAANAAKKFGFARSATDSAGLMAAADIDVLLIGTRHATHAELVCAALRAGKAVFVEKPLAITREGLSKVLRAINETGNDRLMVGFNRRFSPLLNQLKDEWGKRVGPHVIQYRINAGPLEKGSWYSQSATEGSRFVGEGGHFIDTVSWWLEGDPLQVAAAATAGDQDNLVATLNFPTARSHRSAI